MATQRGRCTNTEFCAAAVSNTIVPVADGDPFVCSACGDSLAVLPAARAKGRRVALVALQVAAVAAGGASVAWKMHGKPVTPALAAAAGNDPAPAGGAPGLVSPDGSPVASGAGTPGPGVSGGFVPIQAGPLQAGPLQAGQDAPAGARPAAERHAAAMLPAAAAPGGAAGQAARQAPAKVLLRLAGADTLSNNLMQRLAAGYLALIGDTGIAAALDPADGAVEVSGLQANTREAVKVAPTSSADGFNALLRGTADMTLSVRRPTPDEIERLAITGDVTSPANERVIGAQAVAVVVSPANRVPALTTAQLRNILAGRIKDWAETGGTPGPIQIFTLDSRAGGGDGAEGLLAGREGVAAPARHAETEAGLAAAAAGDRNGIAFVTWGNTGAARVVPVSDGPSAAVLPSELAIATESYPLTRRVYFYTGADAGGGYARRFADYVASPTGQAVVEAAGLVPLTVRAVRAPLPDLAPDRLRQMVAGASRITIDFRFQQNSTELDSRGLRDLDRLAAYVRAQRITPSRIMLAAFADNSGPAPANLAMSQRRADAVAAALAKAGMAPGKVAAFGAELPVADNATGEGRERNRRVEVYLAPG